MSRMTTAVIALALFASMPVSAADVYKVTVTRKDQDLYKIDGGKNYIVTRFCYEYVFSDEAILRIDSPSGYSVGKIIFSSGGSCDVEKII